MLTKLLSIKLTSKAAILTEDKRIIPIIAFSYINSMNFTEVIIIFEVLKKEKVYIYMYVTFFD